MSVVERTRGAVLSPWCVEAERDISTSVDAPLLKETLGTFGIRVQLTEHSLWVLVQQPGKSGIALRCAYDPSGLLEAETVPNESGLTVEMRGSLGTFRSHIRLERSPRSLIHLTTELLVTDELQIPYWPRDLFGIAPDGSVAGSKGTIHASQRGLRSGVVFATSAEDFSFLYVQDFSALSEYLEKTHTTPADSVGGSWPEMGFALPHSQEHPIPGAQEVTISEVYLLLSEKVPSNEIGIARTYLELMADGLRVIPTPQTEYRDWPGRAAQTLRDLTHSPVCAAERRGVRYLLPYVGDNGKPPESMVQLAVLRPLRAYERWAGRRFPLSQSLQDTLPTFYDGELGSMRRWLDGEPFENKAEEGQSHRNMDSWYLYYVLLSLVELAEQDTAHARRLLRDSLPFAIRVAHRFDYRWPVMFDLETLDIVRQESEPGAGGELDVAGLYALVAVKAYQLFDDPALLEEARRAADSLEGLGFSTAYQTNTTAFGMQAALVLHLLTGERRYLDRALVCLANLIDNAWLWHARYGHSRHYLTSFGIFPLRDAPYLAAYEEGELLAVFGTCLELGGDKLPAFARLLLSEYVRFALHRAWEYYPESLPVDAVATHVRNGHLSRSITIPLEDLQDGWEQSGTVGQEIYGAGMAMAFATRHYRHLAGTSLALYLEYPITNEQTLKRGGRSTLTFELLGSRMGRSKVRIVPLDAATLPDDIRVVVRRPKGWAPLQPTVTEEGHLSFEVRGNDEIRINWAHRSLSSG